MTARHDIRKYVLLEYQKERKKKKKERKKERKKVERGKKSGLKDTKIFHAC